MRMKSFSALAGVAMVAALEIPSTSAFAKGDPPLKELTNTLSVPAIFVPDTGTFGVSCPASAPGDLVAPTGTPSTSWEVPGYY